jgi:predicted methyltransferase
MTSMRSPFGAASFTFLLSSTLLGCGAPPASHSSSSGGEEEGDGMMACHGHGPEGDFTDAECFARMFDAPERDAWQRPDEVVTLLAIREGMNVVDLGAGTGYFESRLSAAVGPTGTVLALDVEPAMLDYMQARFEREELRNVGIRQIPMNGADLAVDSVDRILIVNTWHHIHERTAYAAGLRDALRAHGTITIVDFTLESTEGPPAAMRLSPEVVIEELEAANLHAEVVVETLPNQWVVRARQND